MHFSVGAIVAVRFYKLYKHSLLDDINLGFVNIGRSNLVQLKILLQNLKF